MRLTKTKIGGFFSLFFFGAAIFIFIQASLYFKYENINETKAQIPTVVAN